MLGYLTATRTAASPPAGSHKAEIGLRTPSPATTCACACSTAAAARWAVAAAPATRPSWPQPGGAVQGQIRLTEQGEVIASGYANPEVGRRNLEVLAAATLEATLPRDPARAPNTLRRWTAGGCRLQGLPQPGLRDRRLRAPLLGIHRDLGNRRPQHRQPPGVAQKIDGHRRPAGDWYSAGPSAA